MNTLHLRHWLPGGLFLVLVASGCSMHEIRRFVFNQADQYRCMQENEHKVNQSMENLKCMGRNRERDAAFEEYDRNRKALGTQAQEP